MIHGIGMDVVRVARFEAMLERHGVRAAARILAPEEMPPFADASQPARFLAKRFAAKEALAKALGTGVRAPVLLTSMAVTHDALGKPGWAFSGELAQLIQQNDFTVHLSISDESDIATAFVILEKP